jgi:hypothetical protein
MKPTPEQIESIRRAASDLLYRIYEEGLDMGQEFMDVLGKLATNPVREDFHG